MESQIQNFKVQDFCGAPKLGRFKKNGDGHNIDPHHEICCYTSN